jgi:hypothetical protein
MKRSSWLVSVVLASFAALLAAPGCSGGRKTVEPTTLPSASRPARPPTRARTEQSRKDPLEVDDGSERMGTLGGPLERRRLPSDQEPLDVPEVETPREGERSRTAAKEEEEEVPEDLERGGPDPGAKAKPGGLIPIDVPPNAGR